MMKEGSEGMRVLLATRNPGKVREFQALLGESGLRVVSADDLPGCPDVEEDGATFRENALKKAHTLARWSGLLTVADDSGLEVDALSGRPGVYSARYGGQGATEASNYLKLLGEMANVPSRERTARFRCAVAVVTPDGQEAVVSGVCEGTIGWEPRGDSGFGYDPVFHPGGGEKTMAELTRPEKNAISHRAKAMAQALPLLLELARDGW